MQTVSTVTLTILACLFFAGCSNSINNALEQMPTETTRESQAQTNQLLTSTGNVDEDFAQIEASLESMNADVDFPSVSEAELTVQ